ncbi:MAG TPA: EthD family reductase [Candidatus Nanopelagicales bacterium]|nr:EthD family reductase [Candidatus Nanopelagicales bacterium]
MFKAMILLTRGEHMSAQEFATWWLTEHAPKARDLPGVREIRFNLVTDSADGIDGIAELWFDDQEAFEAAYATPIGKAVAQDSLDHVAGRIRLFVEENQILSP